MTVGSMETHGFIGTEDNEDEKIRPPRSSLSSKVLVSAVRVDSYFSEELMPSFQASLVIKGIRLCLYNHYSRNQLNEALGGQIIGDFNLVWPNYLFPQAQGFCGLSVNSLTSGLTLWKDCNNDGTVQGMWQANLKSSATVSADFVDGTFLAQHHLLLPSKLHLSAFVLVDPAGPGGPDDKTVDVLVSAERTVFRFGHFAHSTLIKSLGHWEKAFMVDRPPPEDGVVAPLVPFAASFVLCNFTQDSIRFGQAGTEENLLLKPKEATVYSWRSHRARRLQMRICVEGLGYWRWSEPFDIPVHDEAPLTVLRSIDHKTHLTTLVVRIEGKKGRRPIRRVIVSGLVSALSLLRDRHHQLEVKAVLHKTGSALAAAATVSSTNVDHQHHHHRSILPPLSAAPSFVLQPEYVQGVKVRLVGIGTLWSSDIIPLR